MPRMQAALDPCQSVPVLSAGLPTAYPAEEPRSGAGPPSAASCAPKKHGTTFQLTCTEFVAHRVLQQPPDMRRSPWTGRVLALPKAYCVTPQALPMRGAPSPQVLCAIWLCGHLPPWGLQTRFPQQVILSLPQRYDCPREIQDHLHLLGQPLSVLDCLAWHCCMTASPLRSSFVGITVPQVVLCCIFKCNQHLVQAGCLHLPGGCPSPLVSICSMLCKINRTPCPIS